MSLISKVQEKLNVKLLKIDPQTAQADGSDKQLSENKLWQAAIPAALVGLHKYGISDEGAGSISSGTSTLNLSDIFFDRQLYVIQNISAYSGATSGQAQNALEQALTAAVESVNESVDGEKDMMNVKNYLSGEIKDIILYLPPTVNVGAILEDNTIDDKENKMEGPVSSTLKKLGNIFSSPDEDARPKHEI